MDNVEKREENLKPVKLFSITIFIYDDGVLSGYGTEYREMGRLKNQKLIIPDKEDFLSSVRSILPTAIPAIKEVVEILYNDLETTDGEGSEKIAKCVVDIYNDGFIDGDFSEMVKGNRGAPKAWRQPPHEFVQGIKARVGNLSNSFTKLIENSGTPAMIIEPTKVEIGEVIEDAFEEEEEE